jgi:membrane-associated phospholipid phosphatase
VHPRFSVQAPYYTPNNLNQGSITLPENPATLAPPLWSARAPTHFDSAIPWWIKLALMLALLAAAFFVDEPLARWAFATDPLHLVWGSNPPRPFSDDTLRELTSLEQFGQVVSSIALIAAVALIDKAGKPKALALALACGITAAISHLLKDLIGRGRPAVFFQSGRIRHVDWPNLGFLGWGWGFQSHYAFGSFPSAHTTGAFALATGLAWFYPRARPLLMTLATLTAAQRILHHEHFLSDTLAGIILSVATVRLCLHANLAGKLIALMPPTIQKWWLADTQ